jgi:hypothetical protein
MKSLARVLSAAGLALGLALTGVPAPAQQQPSPAAIAAAREILTMQNASNMYTLAVPNVVARTKDVFVQNNLNYRDDLDAVAPIIVQRFAGREQEIGEQMARTYAGAYTEQELKDLVAFYKSPLGQKLLLTDPRLVQMNMVMMNQWAQTFTQTVANEFRTEMHKRGKDLSGGP